MGFLLSRRWVLFGIVVVALAYGCWWLGGWQFDRLHQREASNTQIRQNLAASPAPAGSVLLAGRPLPQRDEWRRVVASGTYLGDRSVVIRYQTRDGSAGVDVATPLRTDNGRSVLVDRGWMPSENSGSAEVKLPPPPSGRVTVEGWARADGTGDSAKVTDGAARAVSGKEAGQALGLRMYDGFVDLEKETPAANKPLVVVEKPDLGNGPHFFYGLQWWFFALLAVFGFGYLAYDERRKRRVRRDGDGADQSARSAPPSTGSIAPDTKLAEGESRKAAAAPNSSGRP